VRRPLPLLLLAVALTPVPAISQTPAQRVKLVAFTFDHWRGATGPALLRPTLRFTTYSPRGPGAEFAAVVFPDGISIQPPGVLLGLQGGVVQPITVGPVTLLPRAGGAALTALGLLADSKLIHIVPGVQAGLGVLIPVDRKSTLRLDVTRHVYRSSYDDLRVWSFGFGISGGLRRTR
jgi:hypothetical protein